MLNIYLSALIAEADGQHALPSVIPQKTVSLSRALYVLGPLHLPVGPYSALGPKELPVTILRAWQLAFDRELKQGQEVDTAALNRAVCVGRRSKRQRGTLLVSCDWQVK